MRRSTDDILDTIHAVLEQQKDAKDATLARMAAHIGLNEDAFYYHLRKGKNLGVVDVVRRPVFAFQEKVRIAHLHQDVDGLARASAWLARALPRSAVLQRGYPKAALAVLVQMEEHLSRATIAVAGPLRGYLLVSCWTTTARWAAEEGLSGEAGEAAVLRAMRPWDPPSSRWSPPHQRRARPRGQ